VAIGVQPSILARSLILRSQFQLARIIIVARPILSIESEAHEGVAATSNRRKRPSEKRFLDRDEKCEIFDGHQESVFSVGLYCVRNSRMNSSGSSDTVQIFHAVNGM
jgi:hypothetical protein